MTGKQISFFAAKPDIHLLLSSIEAQRDLQYARAGHYESPDIPLLNSLFDVPNLGEVERGDRNLQKRYLILNKGTPINSEKFIKRDKGVIYIVDQKLNKRSVEFRPGGIFQQGILIIGDAGTISNERESVDLYNYLKKEIKRLFSKIGACYVGPTAEKLLDKGWRLTIGVKASPLLDLKRG